MSDDAILKATLIALKAAYGEIKPHEYDCFCVRCGGRSSRFVLPADAPKDGFFTIVCNDCAETDVEFRLPNTAIN